MLPNCHCKCVRVATRMLHHTDCPTRAVLPASQAAHQRFFQTQPPAKSDRNEALLLLSVGGPTAPVTSGGGGGGGPPFHSNSSSYSYSKIDHSCPEKLFRAAAATLLSISPSLSPKASPKTSQMPPAFNLGARVFSKSNHAAKKATFGGQATSASFNEDDEQKGDKIGIYNPTQRKALLARFAEKRKRRRYTKKVRYNCRKNLADTRVRVKGRFVKKATGALPLRSA